MLKAMQCVAASVFHPVSSQLQQLPLHLSRALCKNETKCIQLCNVRWFLFYLQWIKTRAVTSQTSLRFICSGCHLNPKSKSNCNAIVFPFQIWHCLSPRQIFKELHSQFSTFIFNTSSLLQFSTAVLYSSLLYDIHLF